MQSLRKFYNIGMGPSSSHTMGPKNAARIFAAEYPGAVSYRTYLYGSLALTGKGHLTDVAVQEGFSPKQVEIIWKTDEYLILHPNGMKFEALDSAGNVIGEETMYSTGGGAVRTEENFNIKENEIYPHKNMDEILAYTADKKITLWQYVGEVEGEDIWPFLSRVWQEMKAAINRGLETKGVLPGSLHLMRKAGKFGAKADSSPRYVRRINALFSYALAVAEENAAGGQVVTAPTCGSCGVLPAVLKLSKDVYEFEEGMIIRALATAGLIGNLAKANASISGAEVGCQGEVGVACAMAAAAVCQLEGGNNKQIAYAAEMGLEHHLGLTCDPIDGLVQIPCIERNAMAAGRALDCATYAIVSDADNKVSYDEVLDTMMQTGRDMNPDYRETAKGGLAYFYKKKEKEHAEKEMQAKLNK
ncbi:L-serine dehydratase [Parelusimicrobium proximum]|uniref:L-serine ammonia-lyase n=1 Tax=Parelusimicrobium proximum TaxID=3228953 RepID=UPI003D169C3C